MLFAHLKRILKLDRLRLRGPNVPRTSSSSPPPPKTCASSEPKFISPVDPASMWTGANKGLAFFAYATNYLIDLDHAVIVDVEGSTPSARRRSQPPAL
jgi:hypothetical protein